MLGLSFIEPFETEAAGFGGWQMPCKLVSQRTALIRILKMRSQEPSP